MQASTTDLWRSLMRRRQGVVSPAKPAARPVPAWQEPVPEWSDTLPVARLIDFDDERPVAALRSRRALQAEAA